MKKILIALFVICWALSCTRELLVTDLADIDKLGIKEDMVRVDTLTNYNGDTVYRLIVKK